MVIPELATLRRCAVGTLGHSYAAMLDENGYQPFSVSPDLTAMAKAHPYFMRYVGTHDFVHVVSGFDTSLAGEMGVLSATVAQGFAPAGRMQERIASCWYPLRQPTRWRQIAAYRRLGRQLGASAGDLFCFPYEDALDLSLQDVRAQLGLPLSGAV